MQLAVLLVFTRIAQSLEKPAKIIVNQVTSSLAPLLKLFENNKDYPDGTFVTSENAKEFIEMETEFYFVVVDVNRPSYTDAPDLIPIVSSLVVIDHHRQTGESFENPTLSYVEPFASSASEMVAEILQYAGEEIRVKAVEADALYSGIMVDTNNFMNKTGCPHLLKQLHSYVVPSRYYSHSQNVPFRH